MIQALCTLCTRFEQIQCYGRDTLVRIIPVQLRRDGRKCADAGHCTVKELTLLPTICTS